MLLLLKCNYYGIKITALLSVINSKPWKPSVKRMSKISIVSIYTGIKKEERVMFNISFFRCISCTVGKISGFHREFLQSITFISQLMYSIIQNLEIKIYVVQKLKDTKLKITPICFGSYVIHHQGV